MKNRFFEELNYTISNEDTSLELDVMPENTGHVFVIASSGSRVTPLFSKNPKYITCVDSSVEQLYFTELRIASFRKLSHKAFISFWGYPGDYISPEERKELFSSLKLFGEARLFSQKLFKKNNWEPLLYFGKWENTFQKISKINRIIVGEKGLKVFDCQTNAEQEEYLRTQFPHKAWAASIFLLGNATVFNALLYKGDFPKKNIGVSAHQFYMDRFQRLFKQGLVRRNFFLQLVFFGKLRYVEGVPLECNPEIFHKAKIGLQTAQIKYVNGDIVEETKHASPAIDFISLSDAPSYFKPPREQNFLQDIRGALSKEGVVVSRYYLRIPENLITSGYRDITDHFRESIGKEKTQVYNFGIYKKK